MKYQIIIHHWGGGCSILSHRNKSEWSERTAKKHIADLVARNLTALEFKALHICASGDVWGFQRLTK